MNSIDAFNTIEVLTNEYQPVKVLGEGTHGRTWLAIERSTGKKVAVKALKLENDIKNLELFERETEVLKGLDIYGVPKFYRSIMPPKDQPGTCFLVQEYVEFPSLQKVLDRKYKFSEEEVLEIMLNISIILTTLQTKYSPPIIHRDIKPSNILSNKDEWGIHAYLIDFGSVANPQKLGEGSTIAGTFGYMPLEQLQGKVCIQSDYYALGATALHLLTGVAPHKIPLEAFRLNFEPVIEQQAPNTTEGMRKLLSILLSPEPSQRPENAEQLTNFIARVKRKLMPTTSMIEKFKFKFKRNRIREVVKEQKLMLETLVPRAWPRVEGTLRCVHTELSQAGNLIIISEYTFKALGVTWVGASYIHTGLREGDSVLVEYNPTNPRMNRIVCWN